MLRRFLGFLIGGTLLVSLVYLSYMNGQAVEFRYSPTTAPITGPLMMMMLGAFFLGALLIFLLALLRETQWTVRDLRRRQRDKKAESERSRVAAGRQLQWGGQADQARNILRRTRKSPETADEFLILAQASFDSGRLDEARSTLEDGLANHRDDPQLLALSAEVYRHLGQKTVATVQFEKAVSANSKSPRLLESLRDAYISEERWGEALRTEESLLATLRSPDQILQAQPLIRGLRYESALAAGEESDVIQELRSVLAQYPGFGPAAVALGDALCRMERHGEAARVWVKAAQQRPLTVLLERLEKLHHEVGQPKKMVPLYRNLVREHPRNATVALGLLRALISEGKSSDVSPEIERLSDQFPEVAAFYQFKAERHQMLGEWRAATSSLLDALGKLRVISWICRDCLRPAENWQPRCTGCHHWDTLETSDLPAVEMTPGPTLPAPNGK